MIVVVDRYDRYVDMYRVCKYNTLLIGPALSLLPHHKASLLMVNMYCTEYIPWKIKAGSFMMGWTRLII